MTQEITRAKQRAFLRAFAALGNVLAACERAGVGRRTHYDWMDDESYARQFQNAVDIYSDKLEAEADRRATQGVTRHVFYKGDPCGTVTEYSDNLLMFRLKSLRPDKYRENVRADVNVSGTIDIVARLNAARKLMAESEIQD